MNYYRAVVIGALLHDIGKFVQRKIMDEKNIKKPPKHDIEGYNYLKKLFDDGFLSFLSNEEKKIILDIVKEHHNNKIKDGVIGIVRLADWLSSGERKTVEESEVLKGYGKDIKLLSIFETANVLNYIKSEIILENLYKIGYKYPLNELKLDKNVIFTTKPHPNDSYLNLFSDFETALRDFKNKNDVSFEELLQLLYKYTWCIPSATFWEREKIKGSYPDISLYDHLKTTCAIAACLYRLYKNEKINDKKLKEYLERKNWEDKIFCLIHGDISGIQDFIFTVKNKYAAKTLRGRSFYLDFLMEYLARYICKELDLPIANILFCGGGHFYILSYKVDDGKIEEFEKKINDILFKMFKTKVYVYLVKEDVSLNDFLNFSDVWKRVSDRTVVRKLRRFDYKLEEIFDYIDEGKPERCEICGIELDEDKKREDPEIEGYICKYCKSFIELTKILKNSNKFSLKEIENIEVIKDLKRGLNVKNSKEKEFFRYYLDEYNLPDDNGELIIPFKIFPISFPLDESGKILDLNKLAEKAEERTGTKKIAVLKMDVDNLGELFTKGLKIIKNNKDEKSKNLDSISRMSTLSNFLSLFFTGYIPYLIKTGKFKDKEGKEHEFKDNIYLIYAGGDDTLITGSWDAVWELAKKIREDFKEFVCYNPFITLSAGIYLTSPKFKFKRAVEFAEEELERAKDNEINSIKKNSLSIFSTSLNWDLEVKYIPRFWEKLKDIERELKLENELINEMLSLEKYCEKFNEDILEDKFNELIKDTNKKRILHVSQVVAEMLNKIVKKGENGETILYLPYYWRLLYYIKRNYKNNYEKVKFLEDYIKGKVHQMLLQNIDLSLNDLKVAAKITELKWRG
ncbi:Csm1 family CRISPR-associated protein [Methanocaldococcus villosus KIN24-T80]|uniref:CRISPR system single-strand-specific deoxyribonuclease Cas10/Csm1 (subtype III-A) n=1 Tax=Methanocaldococcus villosus KIN24-T80 TaxID=1069083 RepID=N6VRX7_9EURY|nr:type III-A CRISPR-associated protein Cas10/Csm1 [Methanocaldococcus villosus]ENN95916.1 Csm1 family CRISPR-associated protein [Methanocaldococcus villosus KIN24-T80]